MPSLIGQLDYSKHEPPLGCWSKRFESWCGLFLGPEALCLSLTSNNRKNEAAGDYPYFLCLKQCLFSGQWKAQASLSPLRTVTFKSGMTVAVTSASLDRAEARSTSEIATTIRPWRWAKPVTWRRTSSAAASTPSSTGAASSSASTPSRMIQCWRFELLPTFLKLRPTQGSFSLIEYSLHSHLNFRCNISHMITVKIRSRQLGYTLT